MKAPSPRGRSGAVVALMALLAVGALSGPAIAGPRLADEGPALSSFIGKASADLVQASFSIPGFLIVSNFFEGPGPTAQAAIDSLGSSQGFASLPYPGETATSVPGLVSTLTGKSLPSYPFIVNSSYPSNPSRQVDQPGYHLSSVSEATSTTATATAGESLSSPSEVGGFAKATVANAADGFVARSTAHVDLSTGGVTVSGVVATAEVRRSPSGTITKTSSLSIAGLSVGGVKIGVDNEGLTVLGTKVPLGAGGAVDSLDVNGTKVSYLKPSSTSDSVLSPGLQIETMQQLPAPVRAPAMIRFTLGRAFAQGGGVTAGFGGLPLPPVLSGVGSGLGAGLTAAPGLAGGGSTSLSSSTAGTPPTLASAPTGPAAFLRSAAERPRLTFYPILALAASVLLAASLNSRRLTKAGPLWNS